jgi:transposase InsO family protein
MWGADATRFYTRRDGWCWCSGAVDHYTDEVVGSATARIATRFVAMESIRRGCARAFGAASEDCAHGLTIRCDHGSQYLSRAFQAEMKYLGAGISWSFVNEPQGNGMCERFIRTLKQQCLWHHDFETIEEAHQAIAESIERYSSQWLVERLAQRSPNQARDDFDNGRYHWNNSGMKGQGSMSPIRTCG